MFIQRLLTACLLMAVLSVQGMAVSFSVQPDESTRTLYNTLKTPEAADADLRTTGKLGICLDEARAFASRFVFSEAVGLRLAHKHFALTEQQGILEETFMDALSPLESSLKASPVTIEEDTRPASWMWSQSKGTFDLFEYSNDPVVLEFHQKYVETPAFDEFMEGMKTLLEKHDLLTTLCPAIMNRTVHNVIDPEKHLFVERSYMNADGSSPVSITTIGLRGSQDLVSAFETGWSLGKQQKQICICIIDPLLYSHSGLHQPIPIP